MKRYMLSFSGPLAKGKTGLSLSFDGNNSYDSRTISREAPAGQVNGVAVSPTDAANFSARVDHQLTAGNQLHAEYAHRLQNRDNLGVGDFDLPERAYATDFTTDMVRVRNTGVIGKKVFSELRFEFNSTTNATLPSSAAADRSRQRRVHGRRRRPVGRAPCQRDRDRAELRLHASAASTR